MLIEEMFQEARWTQIWPIWIGLVNSLAIVFAVFNTESRWVFGVWLVHLWGLELAYRFFGIENLWSMSHIVLWTPLLLYILIRARHIAWRTPAGGYLGILVATNLTALFLDYTSVALWLSLK